MKNIFLKNLIIIMLINCLCLNAQANESVIINSLSSIESRMIDLFKLSSDFRIVNIYNWETRVVWDATPEKNAPEGTQLFQCDTQLGVKFPWESRHKWYNVINDVNEVAHEWHANSPGVISAPAGYSVGNYNKTVDYEVETENEDTEKKISAKVGVYGKIQIALGISVKGFSIALPPLYDAGNANYDFYVHNGTCCGFCDLNHDNCTCNWGLCPRCNETWICLEHEGLCPGCREAW